MSDHPDLTMYRLIHRGMRADTARLSAAVSALDESQRLRRMPALTRWYDGFLQEFELHHSAEDDLFFPALAERVPVFADQMPRLDAEHHTLEVALVAVGEALGQLADPNVAWRSVHGDAVDALRVAHRELTLHLDNEDADVLPLFVEHMSAIDYEEIGERALKRVAPKHLLFSVPWVMRQADEEESRRIRRGAPLPLKVLWYATRARHARLTRRALGDATELPTLTKP